MVDFELDWLKRWNLYSPQAIALVDGENGKSFTYRELFEASQRGAALLARQFKIGQGDRIATLASNEPEFVILLFSLFRLGATLVPINYRLTDREVDHVINDCQAKLIVYEDAFQAALKNRHETRLLLSDFGRQVKGETQSFSSFLAEEETPALILYTSGTTGHPKGAVLSHRMLFWNSINTSLRLNLTQDDKAVTFAPFFHTGGWNVLTTPLLHRGGQVILTKKFEADQVLKLSEKHHCTILFGVPTTMEMMARSPLFGQVKLSKMRYAIVGGEPMPVEAIRKWDAKGIPVRQGYGLTEFGPNVFSLNEQDAIRKIGSIGFPNFYVDVKVVDDNGNEVGPDEIGELILRGPMCMSGYWQNEKATQETIRDGWLYTGDLVRKDSEAYFYVVGRKKDMYISGGENVYPTEVEQVIRQIPGVHEVAVIGVADEKWGEVGRAFIVADDSVDTTKVLAHCQKNLAKFKIPKHFDFVGDLPKGDSGKILKKALRNQSCAIRS